MISKGLRATDEDPNDEERLRFRLASVDDFDYFNVALFNGSMMVTAPLRAGTTHNVAVAVSDGSRRTSGEVTVKVRRIMRETLQYAVEINFVGLATPDAYLAEKHSDFMLLFKEVLPSFLPERDLEIISLKRTEPQSVRLLFVVRKPPGSRQEFYTSKAIQTTLLQNQRNIQQRLDIRVGAVLETGCAGVLTCAGTCQYDIYMGNTTGELPTTSERHSVLTPSFTRQARCLCDKGRVGSACEPICDTASHRCLASEQCLMDASESRGYRCAVPNVPPQVSAFGGASLQTYVTRRRSSFGVSMRFRTNQRNSTLLAARDDRSGGNGGGSAPALLLLQIAESQLKFTFNCGGRNSETQRMQSEPRVDDGNWHDVRIEPLAGDCAYRVVLDDKFESTSASGTERNRKLLVTRIYVGGRVSPADGSVVHEGFIGCVEDLAIDGHLVKDAQATVTLEQELNTADE